VPHTTILSIAVCGAEAIERVLRGRRLP